MGRQEKMMKSESPAFMPNIIVSTAGNMPCGCTCLQVPSYFPDGLSLSWNHLVSLNLPAQCRQITTALAAEFSWAHVT